MSEHDIIVVGAGPGGYVAAIRAAQLGLNVGCIEAEKALGGTCLRVGCIPSKAMLESSETYEHTRNGIGEHGVVIKGGVDLDLGALLKRKDKVVKTLTAGVAGLFKKNKVTRYEGHGSLLGTDANGRHQIQVTTNDGDVTTVSAAKVIIATGSKVAPLRGVEMDGDRIGGSTEALNYPEVPKKLVVIGGGVIGLELGSVWRRLGSEVTVLEYLDRILPGMDGELATHALKVFKKQGIQFQLGARVTGATVNGNQVTVTIDGAESITCDRVLLSVGRIPNTEGLGLERIGIETDQRGRIPVNGHFETSVPGIFAIGDVIEGPMLAHKAEEDGVACVEQIVTGYGHVDYNTVAAVVYTHPEIASVGQTEEDLKEKGIAYNKGSFPFMANGRAKAAGDTDGFVKILADKETDRVLGVHMLGAKASEMISEATMAMAFEASSEDIARICHAHPTLSEVTKEAALAVDKRAIHI